MKEILWKKCPDRDSLCDVRLTTNIEDVEAQRQIINYLNTVDLYQEKTTGIGPPSWSEDGHNFLITYVMTIEFEHLIMMSDVLDIKFVEEV